MSGSGLPWGTPTLSSLTGASVPQDRVRKDSGPRTYELRSKVDYLTISTSYQNFPDHILLTQETSRSSNSKCTSRTTLPFEC